MNKLPTKQIYLLLIIVVGIITLSAYSTYAIFTLESETSDIVSMNTSNYLNINSNIYEYNKVIIPANSSVTTDIDIYNNFDYDLCYSIWYKIVNSNNINTSLVSIYQNTKETLTTSGSINPVTSRRINIIIKNNNTTTAKVNIGISYSKNEGTCELNIPSDKHLITSTTDETKTLSELIIKSNEKQNNESNYITYKDTDKEIILSNNKLLTSNNYTYQDEIFTLTNPQEIDIDAIDNNQNNYTCISNTSCRYLYKINEIKEEDNTYKLTKYDLMVGYLKGESGIRKNNQNYYYYGDNPNNFIYYNCIDESNLKTCELWRIIGVFNIDNKYLTKIIKDDTIGTYEYSNTSNTWNTSNILNTLKRLNINDIKTEINYKIENVNNNNEITLLNENNISNIMLMNLSDYINTSICENKKINEFDLNCQNNNWLNKNYDIDEWTMTVKYIEPYIDQTTNELINPDNNTAYSIGSSIKETNINTLLNIRPVIYLKENTNLLSGSGTFDSPYIVK